MSAYQPRELWTPDVDAQPLNVLGRPDGQIEYSLRTEIRDYIALRGYDEAREFVADVLVQERNRKSRS